jgi:hypothetical protein
MEYSKIVSVTGLPGLYELINTKSDGAIVRSLDDKTTKFASSRIHNFSHLESIEVYTVKDNVNLVEVFQAMANTSDPLPDTKDNASVKKYFEKVYPDIDFERVYNSDLKKMVKWFEVLRNNNIEIKLSEPEPVAEPETEEVKPAEEEPKAKKEETKAKTKKESAKTESSKKTTTSKKKEEEPKKSTGSSKKSAPPKKAAKKKK